MDDREFDAALMAAAFEQMARKGWARLSIAEAARSAGLPLDRARSRFPGRTTLLVRFGLAMDQAALTHATVDGPPRDRLFDLLMRRIDFLQPHRAGVIALLQAVPTDPVLAMVLAAANLRSMGWMLAASGIPATGVVGGLRAKGLLAVWLATLRAWQGDQSVDLAATMSALDRALTWAERCVGWIQRGRARPDPAAGSFEPEPPPAPPEPDPLIM